MRMIWWTAALLLMAGQLQVANADITDAMTAIADLGHELVRTYNDAKQRGDTQLAQSKKDALASIDAALIHMSVIKEKMADNLRCLGENQAKPDAEAQSKFNLCFHALKTQNDDLRAQVGTLKSSIELADR